MDSFNKTQHAVEIALGYVDGLMEQGLGRSKALDHAVQRYGVKRSALASLLNDRDYGFIGDSGETEYSVVSTPQGLMGTSDDR